MEKSMREILDETVQFYSENPTEKRSPGQYNGPNSTYCAIGRCLIDEVKVLGESLPENNNELLSLVYENGWLSLDQALLPEYQGHSLLFWQDLQNLHDLEVCWTQEGLSETGKELVKKIENRILENYY